MALSGFNNCACPPPTELEQRCFPLRNEENDYPGENDLPEVSDSTPELTPFRIPVFDANYYTENTYDAFYGNHKILDANQNTSHKIADRWLPIFQDVDAEHPVEITVRNPNADTEEDQTQQAQKFASNIGFFMPVNSTENCDITYSFKFLDNLNEEIKTFSCTWTDVILNATEYSYSNTYATTGEMQEAQEADFTEWRNNYCRSRGAASCIPYGRSLQSYYEQDYYNNTHFTEITLAPDLIHASCFNACYDTKRTFSCGTFDKRATSGVSFSLGAGDPISLDPVLDGPLYYDYIVLLRDKDTIHVYYGEDLRPGKYAQAKNDMYPCNGYIDPQGYALGRRCYSRVMASRYICSFDMSRYAKMTISVSIKPSTASSCAVLLDGVSHRSDIAGRGLSFSSIYIPSKAVDNTGKEYHPCPYPLQPISTLVGGRWPAKNRHYFNYNEGNALYTVYNMGNLLERKTTNLTQRFLPDELGQVHMAFRSTTGTLSTKFEPIDDPVCVGTESCVCLDTNNKVIRSSRTRTETNNNRFVGEVAGGVSGDVQINRIILQDSFAYQSTTDLYNAILFSGTTSSGRPYTGLYFLLGPVDYVAVLISYKYDGEYLNQYAFFNEYNCEQTVLYPLPDAEKCQEDYTSVERKNIVYNDIRVTPVRSTSDGILSSLTGIIAIDESKINRPVNQELSFDEIKQAAYYSVLVTPTCDILGTEAECTYTAEGYLNSRALKVIEFVMDLSDDRTYYRYHVDNTGFSLNITSNATILADEDIQSIGYCYLTNTDDITYPIVTSGGIPINNGFSNIVNRISSALLYINPRYLVRKSPCEPPFCIANDWKATGTRSRDRCTPIFYEVITTDTDYQIAYPDPSVTSNVLRIYPTSMHTPHVCSIDSCTYGGTSHQVCMDLPTTLDGFDSGIPEYQPHLHIFSFIKEAPRSGYCFHHPKEQLSPNALVHYNSLNSKKINLPRLIEYLHETLP